MDITSACERVSIMGALDIIGRIHSTRGSDSEDAVRHQVAGGYHKCP